MGKSYIITAMGTKKKGTSRCIFSATNHFIAAVKSSCQLLNQHILYIHNIKNLLSSLNVSSFVQQQK